MFDIGFLELLAIAVVGLFVIGPERLPATIKTVALWIGRIKRSLLETRREIEQQLGADEIRRELHNEQVKRDWEKMKNVRKELEAQINNLDQATTLEHTADSDAGTPTDQTPIEDQTRRDSDPPSPNSEPEPEPEHKK